MRFGEILGIKGEKKQEVIEREILALDSSEKPKAYVVEESFQLTGSLEGHRDSSGPITFQKGEEITLVEEFKDKYGNLLLPKLGEFPKKKFRIIVHNASADDVGKTYYFSEEALEGQKVKINQAQKPKYSGPK